MKQDQLKTQKRFPVSNRLHTQIREQISGPDLHVFTLKFLALKKWVFHFFGVKKDFFKKNVLNNTQLFSADAIVFSIFFLPRKSEKN